MEPRKQTRSGGCACGACKCLYGKRKWECKVDCIFAPYFPAEDTLKFSNLLKVFGYRNVRKMLQNLPESSREDAVTSLCFEAEARIKDPVYGCSGELYRTQKSMSELMQRLEMIGILQDIFGRRRIASERMRA
ncbi:protein MpASLBD8 [Marchantia polymorpha subsp. ruderalis]